MADLLRVYWDSNIWIGLISGEPGKKRAVEYIYSAAKSGTAEIWTSTLSYVEVYRIGNEKDARKPYPTDGLDKIAEMFEQEFIKIIPLDQEVAKLARRLLREQTGLKKPQDAIHLASALRWPIDVLHTYDRNDLLHLDRKLKSKSGTFLQISMPADPPDGPLFQTTKP